MSADHEERLLSRDPAQISWHDLDELALHNPELWERCWNEMKQSARDELESGWRAAESCQPGRNTPSISAQFLALREDLAQQWQPQGGIEWSLIDTLAVAQTQMSYWQKQLTTYAMLDVERRTEKGTWDPPRVFEHQAVEQAAAMVDRYNRIFLRTLRALRDLRRHSPALIVQNAGQVNVAGRQVNFGPETT